MPPMQEGTQPSAVIVTSEENELVQRAQSRDRDAFRSIMQKYNRRMYRMARTILRNENEAEDVVQEAFVSAFTHLDSFRGDASLSTWLARITMNEAMGRLRAQRRIRNYRAEAAIIEVPLAPKSCDPERAMAQRQILRLVEKAANSLPELYRIVFVTRLIEGMSVEDTAEIIGIRVETVKTRLHRARRLLRDRLSGQIGPMRMDAFPFESMRVCEAMRKGVAKRDHDGLHNENSDKSARARSKA
jgi:RNA polymerase sigma-70 factor, ECF subfamily